MSTSEKLDRILVLLTDMNSKMEAQLHATQRANKKLTKDDHDLEFIMEGTLKPGLQYKGHPMKTIELARDYAKKNGYDFIYEDSYIQDKYNFLIKPILIGSQGDGKMQSEK